MADGGWPKASPLCIRCGARWPTATYRSKGLCVTCYINCSHAGILLEFEDPPDELSPASLAQAESNPRRYVAKFIGRTEAQSLAPDEARARADELVIRAMLRWQGSGDGPLYNQGGPHE